MSKKTIDSDLKPCLRLFCEQYVQNGKESVAERIKDVQIGLGSETKSSAGDKHETGRAMLHLEREKLGRQLQNFEALEQVLHKIPRDTSADRQVGPGALVQTDRALFYLAISAGSYGDHTPEVYCVSLATPVARALLGKIPGDIVLLGGTHHTIKGIF